MQEKRRARVFALMIAVLPCLAYSTVAQNKTKDVIPTGEPILWREPTDIQTRDLLSGPGGDELKPDLSEVTFIKEETGGYSPKFRVRDGAGATWVVKFGKEAQPETASARLLWALGYMTETHALAPCVQIKGAPIPKKEVERCEGNGFANVRFEARPDGVKRLDEWQWKENPFTGKSELKGLIIMMALINNWDMKDSNNRILAVSGGAEGRSELHYIISDLGATFGKTGNFITHNRNAPKDYVKSKFVERVEGNNIVFGYDGKDQGLMRGITTDDARWISGYLAKLTDRQIEDAFRAANYSPEDVETLARVVRWRIDQLGKISATR